MSTVVRKTRYIAVATLWLRNYYNIGVRVANLFEPNRILHLNSTRNPGDLCIRVIIIIIMITRLSSFNRDSSPSIDFPTFLRESFFEWKARSLYIYILSLLLLYFSLTLLVQINFDKVNKREKIIGASIDENAHVSCQTMWRCYASVVPHL